MSIRTRLAALRARLVPSSSAPVGSAKPSRGGPLQWVNGRGQLVQIRDPDERDRASVALLEAGLTEHDPADRAWVDPPDSRGPSPEQVEEHAAWSYWNQHRWRPLADCPAEVRDAYLARVAEVARGPFGWSE